MKLPYCLGHISYKPPAIENDGVSGFMVCISKIRCHVKSSPLFVIYIYLFTLALHIGINYCFAYENQLIQKRGFTSALDYVLNDSTLSLRKHQNEDLEFHHTLSLKVFKNFGIVSLYA